MLKYAFLLILIGSYIFLIPSYSNYFKEGKADLGTSSSTLEKNPSSSSGTLERVGVSDSVSVGVTHNYFGEVLPIYVHNSKIPFMEHKDGVVVDVRIVHEIFFKWSIYFLAGMFFLFVVLDLGFLAFLTKNLNNFARA